jgi:hypothetical protein
MRCETYLKKIEKFRLKQEDKKMKLKNREKEKKRKKTNAKRRKEYHRKKKEKEREEQELNSIVKGKKKKVGRPKKRGPKKKRIRRKIIKVYKPQPVFDFKIISCLNGKQNGYVGKYHDYSEALAKFKELEMLNSQIIFPRKYINSSQMVSSRDEFLMLEKNRFGDKKDGTVRNEYGKTIVTKIINNEKWVIRERIKRLVEETFWVYNYDPKQDRKTFSWVFENLILEPTKDKYNVIRVLVYKNKLIVKYDDRELNMVLCKNKSDAIRFYNMISDKTEKNRQIFCLGSYDSISEKRRELEKEIMNITGWPKTKIQRVVN